MKHRYTGPFFNCGHRRLPDNIIVNSGYDRCKRCHNAHGRRYHQPKNPIKPLYEKPECLLADVWK